MTDEDYTMFFHVVEVASEPYVLDIQVVEECASLASQVDEVAEMRAVIESIDAPVQYFTGA